MSNAVFSGTDSIALLLFPNCAPIPLGNISTISYSIYRIKKPVNVLGNINIKGICKGPRVVAGTMIFTLINKHWVNEVIEAFPWIYDKAGGKIYADELPLFDIVIISANEYGNYVSASIYGVDITDEAQVLSVQDLYTENQFSYIARHIDTFDNDIITYTDLKYKSNKNYTDVKVYPIFNTEIARAISYNYSESPIKDKNTSYSYIPLTIKEKFNIIHNVQFTNQNIYDAQKMLSELYINDNGDGVNQSTNGFLPVDTNGVYDKATEAAIKEFQRKLSVKQDGINDDTLYILANRDATFKNDFNKYIANQDTNSYGDMASSVSNVPFANIPRGESIIPIAISGSYVLTNKGYISASSLSIVNYNDNVITSSSTPFGSTGQTNTIYNLLLTSEELQKINFTVTSGTNANVLYTIKIQNGDNNYIYKKIISVYSTAPSVITLDSFRDNLITMNDSGNSYLNFDKITCIISHPSLTKSYVFEHKAV
jgi:peptidoglycan hydrolase-like protein with peptidoglycan-binding domain